jgi:3-hydroxybutyryl-CoA dehydrogenase
MTPSLEPLRRVIVIGGGTMGSGIALVFAAGGWSVDVVEPAERTRATLPTYLRESMQRMHASADASAIRILPALSSVDWRGVRLVCESATEDLPVKQRIFAELERVAPRDIPFASNSSSCVISDIGKGLATQSRMLGLHFLMPAQFVPIVEVVGSAHTASEVVDGVCDIMRAVGKRPIRVGEDVVGFLVNRIQAALMREALDLIDRGVASAEDVDAAVRYGFGFRYAACGPIVQKEHSGWEISTMLYRKVFPTLCNDAAPAAVLERQLAAGHYGMKTGRGFMAWDPENIAREKARYEKALRAALDILQADDSHAEPVRTSRHESGLT